MLSTTALVVAEPLGLLPDRQQLALDTRTQVCESLAVHCTLLVGRKNTAAIEQTLKELLARNPDMRSAALRRADGLLIASVGDHLTHWHGSEKETSTDAQIYVPIVENRQRWGALEVAFTPLRGAGWRGWLNWDFAALMLLFTVVNLVLFAVYLRRALHDLDPQKAVPERVRAALDTIVEGLLVLDARGRIVLANRAFSRIANCSPESLPGSRASSLPWKLDTAATPWDESLRTQADCTNVSLALGEGDEQRRSFKVNATPLRDGRGGSRGVLASFADVTTLEKKQRDLVGMLDSVEASRQKVSRQNDELRDLAMRDPMTGCLNRRSFFEQFGARWAESAAEQRLVCVMADVDHFKSVNDKHGHARGDEVLKQVSGVLRTLTGEAGLVCRFGGEEFCVLLPGISVEQGMQLADGFRRAIAALEFPGLKVTASFGLSSRVFGATSQEELLDQADKSLYHSKRNGRNQVTRFDELPPDGAALPPEKCRREERPATSVQTTVPPQAVTSLSTALSYRDPETAAHAARVANLSVATAAGLMTADELYLLEVAAKLHDIGKVGVPDAILHKPSALTPEEWQIMRLNGRIGVEIINASFQSPELAEIVRYHHAPFGGDPASPHSPQGDQLPLASRIIAICDAYDAMVTNQVYRRGRTPAEAFAELRRMAGKQFDPVLVERLVSVVNSSCG